MGGKYGHLLPDIPPGDNYLYYTAQRGHPDPQFGWRSRYWSFLLKLSPDKPAPTIQAQPGPYVGPFHWENRRLRVPNSSDCSPSRMSSSSSAVAPPCRRRSATRCHRSSLRLSSVHFIMRCWPVASGFVRRCSVGKPRSLVLPAASKSYGSVGLSLLGAS